MGNFYVSGKRLDRGNTMTTLMQITQVTLATAIGVGALLYAATSPRYRPLTDDYGNRFMISAAITLMVMCMPILAVGAAASVIMFVVGTFFMFGVVNLAVGPVPHKMINNRLIDNRRPRGYRFDQRMELKGALA